MQDNTITMHIELSRVHAGALVQFLKKQGFSDCAQVAENCDQALRMFETIEYLRAQLMQAVALPGGHSAGNTAGSSPVQGQPARPVRHRLR